MRMQSYWDSRYMSQGEKTVGHCSFDDERFQKNTEQAVKILLAFMYKHEIAARRVLDFGCGPGRMTKVLIPFFQEVYGVDIVPWAVSQAIKNCQRARFRLLSGKRIPFEDGYFGSCLSWTVLQHIPPEEIEGICGEISRVLESGGRLILYENVSRIPDKSHIWFRSVEVYWKLFDGFDLKASEVMEAMDGNAELHVLMLLRKS